jgi:hypothetical protein
LPLDLIDATQKFLEDRDEKVYVEALQKCKKNIIEIIRKISEIKEDCKDVYF